MVKSIKEKAIVSLPWFILILFYLSEAIGKIIVLSGGTSIFQKSIKLTVLIYFVVALALIKNKIKIFLPIFLLGICFTIGQYFLLHSFSFESLVNFSRYLFPIFLFIYFNNFKLNPRRQQILFKVFEIIIVANSILVLLGFVFQLTIFETYTGSRFGYNGLLSTSSTGTYVYIISLFYFLFKLKKRFFKSWKAVLLFITCFLIGTKALYLGIGVVSVAYLFMAFPNNKKSILLLFSILFLVLGYLFFFQYGNFNQIRESQGIISSVLSYRNQLFMDKTIPYINKNWGLINYLVGGLNDFNSRSQMDFVDVFLFWGILGGLIYLYSYYKVFVTFKLKSLALFFIVFLLFIIFFAGNFFSYATIPIYLLVIKERILSYQSNAN